ncbi:MAG TPA: thioredoxin domain-containing protein [Flavobacteriaceae bacterium]|nr:thioredoxin domain-containing protein [Flavobacteriaceae bacterium]
MEKTNKLIEESSPYLLQHAQNPVHWRAWDNEAFTEAQNNNKLILISIGYSSCHWCHVMAHESFKDGEIASLMNKNFVNIKVDREERPDVDQIYMSALQLMTGGGGWPLNIVALPDGRPIWGGTYLRKEQWAEILRQLGDLYVQTPEKLIDYAEKLTHGIRQLEPIVSEELASSFDREVFSEMLSILTNQFDTVWGGTIGEPKFMMPSEYHFLLRYAWQTNDQNILEHVMLTLNKMSFGGIFDQLGGGFSRYSTDERWHVPHFEKMLYDNAQLIGLYCDAFLVSKNPWYEKVVHSTLEFVEGELTSKVGSFYCALDADSKSENEILEEGAFYVWKKDELQQILKDDFQVFSDYFNINEKGYWENGNYILTRTDDPNRIAEQFGYSENELNEKIGTCTRQLFEIREKRNRPGLDDKSLTSWNGLMLKAFLDAYRVFGERKYLDIAQKNADFILKNQLNKDGKLFHSYKNGKSSVNGFLDDYAFFIEALIALYENTFEEKWLHTANDLTTTVLADFYDAEKSFFYFNSKDDSGLIARPAEFQDNVMPSSNSVMGKNLFKLSHFFDRPDYLEISEKMLKNRYSQLRTFPQAYFNWLDLLMNFTFEFYEVAILGGKAEKKLAEINRKYLPNKVIAGSKTKSDLALLKNRWQPEKTTIHICVDQTCQKPVETIAEAFHQMI